MPIILPTTPGAASAEPFFVDAGSWQQPIGVGSPSRLDMPGDRYGIAVQMPPMKAEDAMAWVSRLHRGVGQEVTFEWQQPDVPDQAGLGASPSIRVATAAQATVIDLKGVGAAGNVFKEGRFFSVEHGGRHFLHHFAGDATVVTSGQLQAPIHPRQRVGFTANDPVHFNPPLITGILQGDRHSWSISNARHVGLAFEIVEGE